LFVCLFFICSFLDIEPAFHCNEKAEHLLRLLKEKKEIKTMEGRAHQEVGSRGESGRRGRGGKKEMFRQVLIEPV
jgi:hypothetical protein